MKQYFPSPSIDVQFKSRLRQETIAGFEESQGSFYQKWQLWLPLSVSLAALTIFILVNKPESVPLSTQLNDIEQELSVIEQQLMSDVAIDNAIEFTNL